MSDKKLNCDFKTWLKLDDNSRYEIINHVWNVYTPEIGLNLKTEIVEHFMNSVTEKGLQYGIRSFLWGDYMLFVIVEDSSIRVPKEFLSLRVNKGVVKERRGNNQHLVKFKYGEDKIVEIDKKIDIR